MIDRIALSYEQNDKFTILKIARETFLPIFETIWLGKASYM